MNKSVNWLGRSLPVYLASGLFLVVSVLFFIVLFGFDENQVENTTLTPRPDSYRDKVDVLLEDADSARGVALLDQYQCSACHVAGAANHIAPSYDGVGARAEMRRPPLTAAAYIYESIVNPSIYIVEGYNNVMRQDYGTAISERDLGDIIAYLLTQ